VIVDKVRNATTKESPVQYEVIIRVWPGDLEETGCDTELGNMVRKAINGIATFPIKPRWRIK
jgi:hypothetical protein